MGYFRPAGLIDVAAGVDADGRLSFWEFDKCSWYRDDAHLLQVLDSSRRNARGPGPEAA